MHIDIGKVHMNICSDALSTIPDVSNKPTHQSTGVQTTTPGTRFLAQLHRILTMHGLVYIYIYIYIYVYVYVYFYISIYISVYVSICCCT